MSKKGAPRRSLEQYAAEAVKEPFVLELPGGVEVKIEQPNYGAIKHLTGETSFETVIHTLVGDDEDAEAILTALDDYPVAVARQLANDIQEHFGLGG